MAPGAKNLNYESNEPAFLRKLKQRYGSSDGQRNPLAVTRPQKRLIPGGDEEEDAPVYVLGDDQKAITTKEYEEMLKRNDTPAPTATDKFSSKPAATSSDLATKADTIVHGAGKLKPGLIGLAAKKRSAKVIMDDNEDKPKGSGTTDPPGGGKLKAKKAKKAKLSFDDDDDG